jgi:hypothetical protein
MSLAYRVTHRLLEVSSYYAFKARQLAGSLRMSVERPSIVLSAVQERILAELKSSGCAIVMLDDLFGASAPEMKNQLERYYLEFVNSPSTQEAARRYNNAGSTRKEYLILNFPKGASIPAKHPLLKFCSSGEIQNLLIAFFGEVPRLCAADYWLTLPAIQDARTGSQNWHRDHEDQKLVKIFIYLTDVSEDAGPTEYIEGSFSGGAHDIIPPKRAFVLGDYLQAADLDKHAVLRFRRVLTGPKWTVIFVNTSGIHRGGYAKRQRGMANITFTSQASRFPCRFTVGLDDMCTELSRHHT